MRLKQHGLITTPARLKKASKDEECKDSGSKTKYEVT